MTSANWTNPIKNMDQDLSANTATPADANPAGHPKSTNALVYSRETMNALAPYAAVVVDQEEFLKEQAKQVASPFSHAKKPKKLCRFKGKSLKTYPASFAKLTNFNLETYLLDRNLSPEAETYIRAALAAPSRHLSGYLSNTVHYPDIRFGRSLKLESLNLEYPFGLMCIYRADVYCVLEQPGKIKIVYPGGWAEYTPDFLVLTSTGIEVWETRHSVRLADAVKDNPIRYQEEGGVYKSAPFEAFFKAWGFKYAIVNEHNLNAVFCRAVRFLHPYIQGTPQRAITDEERSTFVGYVRAHTGVRLSELPIEDLGRRTELALYFLATGAVFTTLSETDFDRPASIRLYATAQDEEAFHDYLDRARPRPANLEDLGYRLKPGALVEFDGVDHLVVAMNSQTVRLRREDGTTLEPISHRVLLDLKPRIGRIFNAEKTFELLSQDAPMEHRMTHAVRLQLIKPYLRGGAKEGERPKNHTTRRALRAYEAAESKGLCGDEAIFPKFYKSGRKPIEFAPEIQAEIDSVIKNYILDPKKCSVAWIHQILLGKLGVEKAPHIKKLYRLVQAMDPHRRAWKSSGKRFALATQATFGDSSVWGSPHGSCSFKLAHFDSTPVDQKLDPDEPQYIASMVDAFDGRVLAHVTTTEAPSELTIRLLILDCIERHGALPCTMVCDWGSEHRTVWLIESLAALNITLVFRPKADPRKGGPVESGFSVLVRELVHNLEGNTKLMRHARMVTKAVNPDQFALWNRTDLKALVDEYFTLRNRLPRSRKPSPDDIAAASYDKYGLPPLALPTVEEMGRLLLPFVTRQKRTVSKRGTIKWNNTIYGIRGQLNELRRFAGKAVKVRWVPEDPTTVYVFLDSPRKCIRLEKLTCTGPAQDILDRALEIEKERLKALPVGESQPTPNERKAAFTLAVVNHETTLKKRKKQAARAAKADTAKRQKAKVQNYSAIPTILFV